MYIHTDSGTFSGPGPENLLFPVVQSCWDCGVNTTTQVLLRAESASRANMLQVCKQLQVALRKLNTSQRLEAEQLQRVKNSKQFPKE